MRSRILLLAPVMGLLLGGVFIACIDADGLDTGKGAIVPTSDATVVLEDGGAQPTPDGACTNTQTDPLNCGVCGNVCGAGTAVASDAGVSDSAASAMADGGGIDGGAAPEPSTVYGCMAAKCVVASCATGFGDCNANADDGCESALGSDPLNCGACGHACGGTAACLAGACQPSTIATFTVATIGKMLVDDVNLYFTTSTPPGVWSLPKTGGAAAQISDGGVAPANMTQVGARLVVADPGAPDVFSVGTDGSAFAVLSAAAGISNITHNGSQVFWSVATPTPEVVSYDVDAGAALLYTQAAAPYFVAANDTAVYSFSQYWLNGTVDAGAPTSDTLYRCALPSCATPVTMASGQSRSYGIALDATNVYWTTQGTSNGDGTVAYCPLGACPAGGPKVYASGLGQPTNIYTDGTAIFWSQSADQTIRSLPAPQTLTAGSSAGSPRIVATDAHDVTHMAVDDMYVYWSNSLGVIARVRK